MGVEYELKFRADEKTLDLIQSNTIGEICRYHMQTTYYDTAQRTLSARKYTLRRRLENARSVCTLKYPVDELGRGETEVECDSIQEAIPELCKLSGMPELEQLVRPGLIAVCGADFQRTAITFSWGGAVLEMALDRGVLTGGDRQTPLYEVEVELKEGSLQALQGYGMLLKTAYNLEEERKSKFRRALDLAGAPREKKTMFAELFSKYDRLLLFDTETTGLDFSRDEIIEFAAVLVQKVEGKPTVTREYDELIALSPGMAVPPMIEKLTGITNQDLKEKGIPKTRLCADIAEMVEGNTLLLAYNAHFDLSFLFYLLLRDGDPAILKGKDKLDLLTVYKDRKPYPHKLCHAIEAYGLSDKVVNSHRAVDDVLATVAVMEEMEKERDDLMRYVNLFGYNPKYGVSGKPIGSVTYKPQKYDPPAPLYET